MIHPTILLTDVNGSEQGELGDSNRLGRDRPIPQHTGIYKLHVQAAASLNSAAVRIAVKLPEGTDKNYWIVAQLLGIYAECNFCIALQREFCSCVTCPKMRAGKHVEYKWSDKDSPHPVSLPAFEYMRKLSLHADYVLSDEKLIPQDGSPFPEHFMGEMRSLCKRLFRIYAHAYIHHFEAVQKEAECEAQLNFIFKHFLYFVREFDLVEDTDLRPLERLIEQFVSADRAKDLELEEVSSPAVQESRLKHNNFDCDKD